MTVATAKQAGDVLKRVLETDGSKEGVQIFLGRWNYVQALWRAGKLPDIDLFRKFLAGELEVVAKPLWNDIWKEATDKDWMDRLIAREAAVHKARSTEWQKDLFAETAKSYGREKIQEWERKFLLRFSALPIISLAQDLELDWWKVKPRGWFYEQVEAGRIGRIKDGEFQSDSEAFKLRGEIVLIDIRLKPVYSDGRQEWESDDLFCGNMLKKLRKSEAIPHYEHGSQKSRFGIAANPDWQDHIRPALAELIGLEPSQVRLERTIEANAISQFHTDLPRAQDGTTDTWMWYEEFFAGADRRLRGGDSGHGGLANVHYGYSGDRWRSRSFRPLAVLSGV